jgi:hypothetical protein
VLLTAAVPVLVTLGFQGTVDSRNPSKFQSTLISGAQGLIWLYANRAEARLLAALEQKHQRAGACPAGCCFLIENVNPSLLLD